MKQNIREKISTEVQNTIEEHNMLKQVKKLVIAFSSGPDSVCLLNVLHTLYGDKIDFHLVYVNHGLRPQKYLKIEEDLTREYALKYNSKYRVINIKVKKKKIGLEAAARELRYSALLNYMNKINAQRIAIGHNLDDMLETFFMNLLRGSGTRGLTSMPPVRLPYIRPLINIKKAEILRYLKVKRLSYSIDETNRILGYRRNLLRHRIIPEFVKINPQIHETIKREIDILKQDDEYFEKQVERLYKNAATRELNHISLDIKKILRYNTAIVNRVAMKVIKKLRGNLDGFESKHFKAIVGLKDKTSGKRIDLPKGLYAQREYDDIIIGIAKPAKSMEILVDTDTDLLVSGDIMIRIRTVSKFDLKRRKPNCEVFDLDEIDLPLLIRNKRKGDYIKAKIGKKKIKNIYHEFKIPLHKRKELMMLCDQKGILWIFGIVRAFRGFINRKTNKILVVEFERTH